MQKELPRVYGNVFLFLIQKRGVSFKKLESTDVFCKIQVSYELETIESIYHFSEKDNGVLYKHSPKYAMFYKSLKQGVQILNDKYKFITDFNF